MPRICYLQQQLDEQLKAAEQRITEARNTAMGALRAVATDTATVVVSRLTGRAPTGSRRGRGGGRTSLPEAR